MICILRPADASISMHIARLGLSALGSSLKPRFTPIQHASLHIHIAHTGTACNLHVACCRCVLAAFGKLQHRQQNATASEAFVAQL